MSITKERSFREILRDVNRENTELKNMLSDYEEQISEDAAFIPLVDATDAEILMHRDAHFGGKFEIMMEYYHLGGRGVQEEFDLSRMENLVTIERESNQNLAAMLLGGSDAERVGKALNTYRALREICEVDSPKNPHPQLIASLILCEDDTKNDDIAAVVDAGTAIIPSLIELLHSQDFNDSLYPGYGLAPSLAAECLGHIGDASAIEPLFLTLGKGEDFYAEEAVYNALYRIGQPAEDFLLKVVESRPLGLDNESAAIALVAFREHQRVAEACLKELQDEDVRKNVPLATHLIMCCEGLQEELHRLTLMQLLQNPSTPQELHLDIQAVIDGWK